jgi:succinoglycan biosynthesis protein ExoM
LAGSNDRRNSAKVSGNPAGGIHATPLISKVRMSDLPKIIVAICTYKRNEPLRTLLATLCKVADATRGRATIGVVVVDDNADQRARTVVDEFQGSFALGCRYATSGHGNISLARNVAVNTASVNSDWVAMVDDDCEPESTWLCEFLNVVETTDADCVTGPMNLRVPPGSPAWLTEQPFFDDLRFDFANGAPMNIAATNNSMIRAAFLRDHPEIRFNPELGKLGGEDMVFYRTASNAGLRIRFARFAGVWGNEPPDRATFEHQVRYRFWLGNSMFVTNSYFGDTRARLFLRGNKWLVLALLRPFGRLIRGDRPQWRYSVASVACGLGILGGVFGFKKNH